MNRVVFLDGENVKGYLKRIAREAGVKVRFDRFDFDGLLRSALDVGLDERRFYFAKIRPHPDTPETSQRLIEENRALHGHLNRQGFVLIRAGNVRANYVGKRGSTPQFREKGVDVHLAVDMVSLACSRSLSHAYLFASDSDYQPAVRELQRRNAKVCYVGFEGFQNKGLLYTTDSSVIISKETVLAHLNEAAQAQDKAA
jgi:hypothetical protein